MKQKIILIISVFSSLICYSQTDKFDDYSTMVNFLQKYNQDTIVLPIILDNINNSYDKNNWFTAFQDSLIVKISDEQVGFDKIELTISNPFSENLLPLSFSLIYDNNLITLFEPGKFQCLKIPEMERNLEFESILNKRKFDYCILIDNKLVASRRNRYFELDSKKQKWKRYKGKKYVKKTPKLFENEKIISFAVCHGEFGGQIFFIDKVTHNIYTVPSTCATSVIEKENKYIVTSSLGHMMGWASIFSFSNPNELIEFNGKIRKTLKNGVCYEDLRPSNIKTELDTIFDKYSLQVFSTFDWDNKLLSIVNWKEITFLAECKGNEINIVNPLFSNGIYTHDPITTQYNEECVLVNMDFYGIGIEKEVTCILFYQDKLIKINWTDEVVENEKLRD